MVELDQYVETKQAKQGIKKLLGAAGLSGLLLTAAACSSSGGASESDSAGANNHAFVLACSDHKVSKEVSLPQDGQVVFDYIVNPKEIYELIVRRTGKPQESYLSVATATYVPGASKVVPLDKLHFQTANVLNGAEFTVIPPAQPEPAPSASGSSEHDTVMPVWHLSASLSSDQTKEQDKVAVFGTC